MYGIIYRATNIKNGKVYIGQTIRTLGIRKSHHFTCSRNRLDNICFHNALRKYGKDSFRWEVLDKALSREELDLLEKKYIIKYDSINNGYNVLDGGSSHSGLFGDDNPRYGIKMPYEMRKRIGDAQRGKKGYWFGKKPTKEHRQNVSRALKGKKKRPSQQCKLSKIHGEWWLIEFPDGSFKVIHSMAKFCREHNLSSGHMVAISKGKRHIHKGFSCKKLNEDVVIVR